MSITRQLATGTLALATVAALPTTPGAQAPAPAPAPSPAVATARPLDAARTVTLPLLEYNRLIDLAARPVPIPMMPPVGAVLTSADLRIRVDRESVQGTFALAGEVLRDGINRIELLPGTTLIDGTIGAATGSPGGGRPLALAADGDRPAALVQGVGPFGLTLTWGAPVLFQPGRAVFTLPVPNAGTAHATLDLPGEQTDVRLSRGLITRRASANGRTTVEATLDPGSSAEVSWSMRDSAPVAAAREARTVADILTLLTIGDSDVRMAALVDVTVVQGEPRAIPVQVPRGYEVTGITGASLDASTARDGRVVLSVTDASLRRHQFLISLERSHDAGSFALDTGMVTLPEVQREKGEIAIEGIGTLELEATERAGVHRMDVRELNPTLASMARAPMLAAFRYQRGASGSPGLAITATRFADAGVLAAVADYGRATTMVTTEGRALTEVTLQVRNRAQPFLKISLPTGATLASVEVAGEPAKPVLGTDGTRIPLLRPGFRPRGPYQVSFVYLHGGTPLAKRGDLPMWLPKMDLPVGIVRWEVFVPDTYSVKVVAGNVIDERAESRSVHAGAEGSYRPSAGPTEAPSELRAEMGIIGRGAQGGMAGGIVAAAPPPPSSTGGMAMVFGRVIDSTGAPLPGASVDLRTGSWSRAVVTGDDGSYAIAGAPMGPATLTASLVGFTSARRDFDALPSTVQMNLELRIGSLEETVTVSSASQHIVPAGPTQPLPPSQNVLNLQRRAAGVLPIRIDVPKAGISHRFVKPLVIDQETTVTLRYKRR